MKEKDGFERTAVYKRKMKRILIQGVEESIWT